MSTKLASAAAHDGKTAVIHLSESTLGSAAVSESGIVHLADLFRIMGDPTRLRIILTCLTEPVSVGGIAQRLGLSASLVSHHLRLLRAARVLKGTRDGKQMFYSACDAHIEHVIRDLLIHIDEPGDDVAEAASESLEEDR